MQYKKLLPLSAFVLSLTPLLQQAEAAGFQLNEHSAAGLGRAFAGEAAIADDASVIARNPAAMSKLTRPELSIVGTYVVPDVKVEGQLVNLDEAETMGSLKEDKVAGEEVIPALYYVHPLDDQWALGFGIFSNFGLSTNYSSKSNITAIADKSAITTININPSISWRACDNFSLGLGFDAMYVDATLSSSYPRALGSQRIFKMDGDDWAYGWNAGMFWEVSENTRIGLSYRSRIKTKIEGKVKSDADEFKARWNNKKGYVKLDMPETAEFSVWQRLSDETAIHVSAMWIGWSSLKEIAPKLNDGTPFPKDPLKWKDTWRYSAGLTHDLRQDWILRAGVAYDETPTSDKHRTYRIPDTDRMWYTLGASWKVSQEQSIDFGYAYLHGKKVDVKQDTMLPVPGDDDDTFAASFKSQVTRGNVQIFSIQYNHRF